jgi:hypothetical protein
LNVLCRSAEVDDVQREAAGSKKYAPRVKGTWHCTTKYVREMSSERYENEGIVKSKLQHTRSLPQKEKNEEGGDGWNRTSAGNTVCPAPTGAPKRLEVNPNNLHFI